MEATDANVIQATYTYGNDLISMNRAGANSYYHFDGLGSVAALSNNSADIVERYEYDVFGQPDTTSSVGNPYLFTGRRYDSETSLYYYRARYYEPYIGRFLQVDPIGYMAGLNLYTYVENNPANWVDPYGEYRKEGSLCIGREKCRKVVLVYTCPKQKSAMNCQACCDVAQRMHKKDSKGIRARCKEFLGRRKRMEACYTGCLATNIPLYPAG